MWEDVTKKKKKKKDKIRAEGHCQCQIVKLEHKVSTEEVLLLLGLNSVLRKGWEIIVTELNPVVSVLVKSDTVCASLLYSNYLVNLL